jgi:hypothetical protein
MFGIEDFRGEDEGVVEEGGSGREEVGGAESGGCGVVIGLGAVGEAVGTIGRFWNPGRTEGFNVPGILVGVGTGVGGIAVGGRTGCGGVAVVGRTGCGGVAVVGAVAIVALFASCIACAVEEQEKQSMRKPKKKESV